MANFLYLFYAAALAVLFISVCLILKAPKIPRILLLCIIAPLVYGNFICGIGAMIGEGELLRLLNTPRFFFHVFATPLIFFIAYYLAKGFGVPLAQRPSTIWILWALSAVLVATGIVQELSTMQLVPKVEMGTLRYAHPVPKPPLGPIVGNLLAIIAGFLIWRRAGWPVLFITSLLMLLSAGIPPKLVGQLGSNAGEIIFMAGFMLGLKRLAADRSRQFKNPPVSNPA